MRNDHPDSVLQHPAQRKRVVELLHRSAAEQWMFVPAMGQQRNVQPRERVVKAIARGRRGIDTHRRRNPLYRPRAVRFGPFQRLHAIRAIRMNRGNPFEAARVLRSNFGSIIVGYLSYRA